MRCRLPTPHPHPRPRRSQASWWPPPGQSQPHLQCDTKVLGVWFLSTSVKKGTMEPATAKPGSELKQSTRGSEPAVRAQTQSTWTQSTWEQATGQSVRRVRSGLTLLSSRPISSAKRLTWASRPFSLGSPEPGKEQQCDGVVGGWSGVSLASLGRVHWGHPQIPREPLSVLAHLARAWPSSPSSAPLSCSGAGSLWLGDSGWGVPLDQVSTVPQLGRLWFCL